MSKSNEEITLSKKIENFLLKNRKKILAAVGIVAVIVVAFCVFLGISESSVAKQIEKIDAVEFALVSNSAEISESQESDRLKKALEELSPYLNKKNVAGVRANLLAADIAFKQNDYENAYKFYSDAAESGKKSYTNPLALFNAAVCLEELNRADEAFSLYDRASAAKDFYLASHAIFCAGRIKESAGDFKTASEYYKKASDTYPSDDWSLLAKSRLIDLKAKGKID